MTMRRMQWIKRTMVVLLGGLLGASGVEAQTAGASGSPGSPGAVANGGRQLLADQLMILSRKCLAGAEQPTAEQLECARTLMEMAVGQTPDDPEVLRLWIELNRRLGRKDVVVAALKRYCNLVPGDDAAQLDLVLAAVQAAQTLEVRVAGAERILASKTAERLSAPLRSRLASYAAAGWREMGNPERTQQLMRQALDLDPSNREAALMHYEMVRAKDASPAEQGQALIVLLRADPFNIDARARLGQVLVRIGAYAQAERQLALVAALLQAPPPDDVMQDWVTCLLALNRLDDAQGLLTFVAQRHAAPATEPAAPTTAPADAGAVTGTLPVDLETLRLLLFHLRNQPRAVEASLALLGRELTRRAAAGDKQAGADALWLTALFAPQPLADAQLAQFAAERGAQDLTVRRLSAWTHMRRGDATAREELAALGPSDPYVLYALARLQPREAGEAKLDLWRKAVLAAPTSLAGILSAREVRLAGAALEPADGTAGLLTTLAGLPRSLREPDVSRDALVRLDVRMSGAPYGYLQPIVVTVELRNTTDLPLAITPQGPLAAQVLVYLQGQHAGRTLGTGGPLVVDARRQLVLAPRQALTIPVRLDVGETGWLLSMMPVERVTLSGLAAIGAQGIVAGRVSVGPLGATDNIDTLERTGLGYDAQTIEAMLAALNDPDMGNQMRTIAYLELVLAQQGHVAEFQNLGQRLTDALGQKFQAMDAAGQAWMVRFLTADNRGRPVLPLVHELAQRSNDPLLRIVYLAAQVTDEKSPALDAALRHHDPVIAGFAERWRKILPILNAPRPASSAGGPSGSGDEKLPEVVPSMVPMQIAPLGRRFTPTESPRLQPPGGSRGGSGGGSGGGRR